MSTEMGPESRRIKHCPSWAGIKEKKPQEAKERGEANREYLLKRKQGEGRGDQV